MFGVRLPRALAAAFIDSALRASEGIAGLSAAMRGLIAARTAVMTAVAAIDADMRRMTRASAACRRLMTIPGVGQLTALAFVAAIDDPSRIRRSRDVGAYLGLVPRRYQSGRGRLRRQHLEMRGQAGANAPVRSRQCHADPLQGPAQTQGLGLRDRQAINDAQSAESLWLAASRSSCMRCCETGRSSYRPKPGKPRDRRPNPAPTRSDARGREQTTARIL